MSRDAAAWYEDEGLPVVAVAGSWDTVLEVPARDAIERTTLPGFLRAQRWFGAKARNVARVRFLNRVLLPERTPPAFLTLLEVRFEDGGVDTYFFPLAVSTGAGAVRLYES